VIYYDPHHWRDHFFDIRGSMLHAIGYRALACTALATLFVLEHHVGAPIPTTEKVHGLVGPALSLLLVFRTNASYDRFWEARKLWGSIVNESRNVTRGASVMLADDPALLGRLIRWSIAFPYAAMHHLRGRRGLGPVEAELPPEAVGVVRDAQHPPLACAMQVSRCINEGRKAGHIDSVLQAALDHNNQVLIDCIGACERILKTPLPFAYVVHLRRALLMYCASLPCALLPYFGWWSIPLTFAVTFILLGVEEIGVEIEEPFGTDDNDLPLEDICAGIEATLRAHLPPPQPPPPA
jgi:putative membrane protein